jgi:pyrimidine operon attenuation protein/uracil phosphoribosyltransferase
LKESSEKTVLHEEGILRALRRIAHEIAERNTGDRDVAIVGIHRRGAFLAQRLRGQLEQLVGGAVPLGDLAIRANVSLVLLLLIYFDVIVRMEVIVDAVLYTGRTVRAAIEALFDYGRPERVQLAVLADRGHRELPIRPDYVGKNLPTSRAEHVHVRVTELDGVDEVTIAPATIAVT